MNSENGVRGNPCSTQRNIIEHQCIKNRTLCQLKGIKESREPLDGGKNPLQQRGSLPVPQVPIRLMNVWYGRPDGILDPLPSRG